MAALAQFYEILKQGTRRLLAEYPRDEDVTSLDHHRYFVEIRYNNEMNCYEHIPHPIPGGMLMRVDNPVVAAQLVQKGASVRYQDGKGSTPLHICRSVEMAAFLVENGANINCANLKGDTPLHCAQASEMAAWLIDHGADIDSRNTEGDTALHNFTRYCDISTQPMAVLIEKGADIDSVNVNGLTPLHYAVQEGLVGAVNTLLYYNADTSVRDNRGFTPLMSSMFNRNKSHASERLINEMLLGYEDIFSCSTNGEPSLLTWAVVTKSPYLDEMMSRGVDFSNLRHELKILLWCIHQPDIEEFKWFWDIFDYEKSWNYCNSILDFLIMKEKYSLFDYVLESPKMDVVIEVHYKNRNVRSYLYDYNVNNFSSFTLETSYEMYLIGLDIGISEILDAIDYGDCNKSKAEKGISVLLSYGYEASEEDAHRIFKLYGYGPLFQLLLQLDVKRTEDRLRVEPLLLTKVLLNPQVDARKYFVSWRDEKEETEEAMEIEDESESERKVFSMGVPSLLELSRNQARVAIWNGYKIQNIKQFYTTVKWMVIPPLIKDILNFKLPIYYPHKNMKPMPV